MSRGSEGRDVGAAVYALANGLGKARAGRDGAARDPRTWRIGLLSSGEISVAQKIAEDRGRSTRAGQAVRVLDIPADAGKGYGAFDHAGGFGHAGELADAIKAEACRSYGTAGPQFVRRITAEGVERVVVAAKTGMAQFVAKVAAKDGGDQVVRAAKKFALIAVAGELATVLGVTPWANGEARHAAEWAFSRWLEQRGGVGSHEARQAVEQVRLVVEQHGESRFEDIGGSVHPVRDRLGWRKGEGAAREWWVPVQTWKSEICAGLDPTFVARTLDAKGMLRRQDTKNLPAVVNVRDQRIRAYVLTAKILDGDQR
ncbi:DUF927 domain-containing protein [uncultured Rhodoblastus sp.]|uniref:DUF927 domain-containing protein n=1 Tax=uncultured Rhodoblastus sp. TaxID=543037 RepID=UPI0025F36D7E|nr:DUF927 domain-containing protein [uncultured Rhodoblastus sp.]